MKSTAATAQITFVLALTLFGQTSECSGQPERSEPSEPGDTHVEDIPPPGVEQLLPRGGIPAIFEPAFVSALEADIPDEAWILGVAIGGEARAYSLNLLNAHEVVNDRIGELNFAAVW